MAKRGRPNTISELTNYKVIKSKVKKMTSGGYIPISQDYEGCNVLVVILEDNWMLKG